MLRKPISEILKEFAEATKAKSSKDKELQQIEHDPMEEEIILVKLSQDKKSVILGTSYGGAMLLNPDDFKIKYAFRNPNKSRVIDIVEK